MIREADDRSRYPANWCWRDGPIVVGEVGIVDIDGVVADAYHRMQGIDRCSGNWADYFKNAGDDAVVEEIARLLDLLTNEIAIVLLSARPLTIRDLTRDWLSRHSVRWDLMILRSSPGVEKPLVFKRRTVRELRDYGFIPQLALEDDRRNVEMFHEEGIPCVYIHSGIHG